MEINLDATQGEWFPFQNSHVDLMTGETIFEDSVSDGRVQIRSFAPFWEERFAKRKKTVEHVLNIKSKTMERISFYQEPSQAETLAERDDAWDYAITGLENFKDSKTGELVECTRENKLKLMKIPVFDRFVARCVQLLDNAGVKEKEEIIKN